MDEDPHYLSKQLITYLGNKRALLPEIGQALDYVANRLGRRKLRILDGFAGSGVVSRLFKGRAASLFSNDLEAYAATVARCFLTNRRDIDFRQITRAIEHLNGRVDAALLQDGPTGFIEELYAPRDDKAIRKGERVFYSNRNARRLDLYCRYLEDVPADVRSLCLGPLLSEASIHANTSGVFKGFHKDRSTGLGRFGGTNADALSRILGEIRLAPPVLSRFGCDVVVSQEDARTAVKNSPDLDLAYFDPPYNQHPYGSNYFMLNLIVHYARPDEISEISGIPADWRRSEYNVRTRALPTLESLVDVTNARFVLLSFNDEGFLGRDQIEALLERRGRVRVMARRYNAFRGSRNLDGRPKHVTEYLFLVER